MNSLTGDTPGPGYYEPPEPCPECEGLGLELQDWDWGETEDSPGIPIYGRCPTCNGEGQRPEDDPFFPY